MFEAYIISVNPSLIETFKNFGPVRAAEAKKLAKIHAINLRDYAIDHHGSVDSSPYGGGDGMVMRADCLSAAIDHIPGEKRPHVILTSPAGKAWKHQSCKNLAKTNRRVAIVCGRFSGIDQRFIDMYVDQEVSIGDFIMSGGEITALAIIDSTLRLIPGVLGNSESPTFDSFAKGMNGILEYPLYTKPPEFRGKSVPEVLRSGDHARIAQWRQNKSLQTTAQKRPDLLPHS